MARIRHIALVGERPGQGHRGLLREGASGSPARKKSRGADRQKRIYMSDGEVNLALLQYKSETGSGLKNARRLRRHPPLRISVRRLREAAKADRRLPAGSSFSISAIRMTTTSSASSRDPNGIIFDINYKGWAMTKKQGQKQKGQRQKSQRERKTP